MFIPCKDSADVIVKCDVEQFVIDSYYIRFI